MMDVLAPVIVFMLPLIVWAVCQTQINTLEGRIDEMKRLKANGEGK
jgi:hypothetical protein